MAYHSSQANVYLMKKGLKVFSPELTKYYTLVDEFCLEHFTKFWPGDLAFLEEFERVIADLLMDGIISGDIELPEFLPVVKVLMLDTTVKIPYAMTAENKRNKK